MKYTEKTIQDLVIKFLDKFESDKRPIEEKYKQLGFNRGTLHRLKNGIPPKLFTIQSITAFLENKVPEHVTLLENEKFRCITCKKIFLLIQKHPTCFRCRPCQLAKYQEANKRVRTLTPQRKQTYFRYEE